MKTSEVLYEAANLIELHGWTRGDGWLYAGRDTSELCLEGGIQAAMGIPDIEVDGGLERLWKCPAYNAVHDYLKQSPFQWNDKVGRTADEVIATLRAAAVIEAAKEQAASLDAGVVAAGVSGR